MRRSSRPSTPAPAPAPSRSPATRSSPSATHRRSRRSSATSRRRRRRRRRPTRRGSSRLSGSGSSIAAEPPVVAAPPPAHEPGRFGKYLVGAIFLAPAVVLLLVWMVYPAIYTVVRSFFGQTGYIG